MTLPEFQSGFIALGHIPSSVKKALGCDIEAITDYRSALRQLDRRTLKKKGKGEPGGPTNLSAKQARHRGLRGPDGKYERELYY